MLCGYCGLKKVLPRFDRSTLSYLPEPVLFLLRSISVKKDPGVFVGGKYSPFEMVISFFGSPFGPISRYCPDFGAVCPDKCIDIMGLLRYLGLFPKFISSYPQVLRTLIEMTYSL